MLIKTFDFGDTDYSSPCTYEMYSGTTLIYVGFSTKGFKRVFSYNFTTERKRAEAIARSTRIVVTVFSTDAEAYQRERELIHAHHPEFNKQCDACSQVQRLGHKLKEEAEVFAAGRQAFKDGVSINDWPRVGPLSSGVRYRTKRIWQSGWRKASFEPVF